MLACNFSPCFSLLCLGNVHKISILSPQLVENGTQLNGVEIILFDTWNNKITAEQQLSISFVPRSLGSKASFYSFNQGIYTLNPRMVSFEPSATQQRTLQLNVKCASVQESTVISIAPSTKLCKLFASASSYMVKSREVIKVSVSFSLSCITQGF